MPNLQYVDIQRPCRPARLIVPKISKKVFGSVGYSTLCLIQKYADTVPLSILACKRAWEPVIFSIHTLPKGSIYVDEKMFKNSKYRYNTPG
jgi:hypothetical protein